MPDNITIEERKKGRRINKNINIFIICLFISICAWILIKLSKEYTTDINFKVNLINIPYNKVCVTHFDSTITATVKAQGIKILYNQWFQKEATININIKNLFKTIPNKRNYQIVTAKYIQDIEKQLQSKFKILSLQPDTLYLNIEKAYRKTVPITIKCEIEPARQYGVYGNISIKPDSIYLFGPKKALSKIQYIETEKKSFHNLKENLVSTIFLEIPDNSIHLSSNQILLMVPVEKFTEEKIDLPIKILNLPSNQRIKVTPEKAKVTYKVALKDYKKINPTNLLVGIDYSKINRSSNKFKIQILKQPTYLKVTKIAPDKADFILIRND